MLVALPHLAGRGERFHEGAHFLQGNGAGLLNFAPFLPDGW